MSQFPLMWKKYRIFLSLIVGRWQQLGLQIHHSSPGLWWDWKLFVFVICTRERLFTVIGSASEHLKSQSKQSSNNSCCLDISSLLRKLERKKICVSSVLSHYECDRIMTNDFNMFLCKNDKKSRLPWEKVVSCHFEIKITSERNLKVAYFCLFQLKNTNIRSFASSFFDLFCSAVCKKKIGAGAQFFGLTASWQ